MDTSLTSRGYGLPKSSLTTMQLERLKLDLTVKPMNVMDMGNDKSDTGKFPLYMESSQKIYMPKVFGIQKYGLPSVTKIAEGADIDAKFVGSLRPIQLEPVKAFLEAAHDPKRMGGIISLGCGCGKTVCALYIIAALKKKTMIIAHKEFLLDQWRERINEFLPGMRVGLIKASKVDVDDKDIIVASVQSLSMKTYDSTIFDDIALMVIDECHRTGAQVFSRVYQKHNVRYTLGLSATVNRKDGLSKVFKWHIGDVVYKSKKVKDTMKIIMKEYYEPDASYSQTHTMYNKQPNMSRMINNICSYKPRIQFLIESLQEVLRTEPHRRIIILSDRRGHLEALKVALDQVGITSGYYYGGLKPHELKESEKQQVLLATFAYSSEGLDVKGLNTMVLASPKSDIIQSVGRILRDKPEDRQYQPLVIDIVDNFSIFPSQARKRVKYYKSQGYEVSEDKLMNEISLKLEGKCFIVEQDD
jgi:superfamily II DNA or RNA helicase